jgi:hypothetical protein
MNDEFEYVQLLKNSTNIKIPILPNETVTIYVSNKVYEKDVTIGQNSIQELKRQLKCDISRSNVCIDGKYIEEFEDIPLNINTKILKFMTQNVMALPLVGIQHSSEYPVCEPGKYDKSSGRMIIQLWGDNLNVFKKLMIPLNDDMCVFVDISINVNMLTDDYAVIDCKYSSKKKWSNPIS